MVTWSWFNLARNGSGRFNESNPTHLVFQNNLMGVFNVLEAAIRFGVSRFVNISSETVPGFFFPERDFLPDYVPVNEEHPTAHKTPTRPPSTSASS